ncbi:MAG: RNA polymerase sigma-70 factor [Bacteroidales bacterium]|nr:RNA polymerase sigma-70 factor [Bacteroidales bacterium]
MHIEDKDILALFSGNEEQAVQQLFAKYYRALSIYALKFIDDVQAAEDIVQEMMVRFWEDKKYQQVKGSLKSYLFTSVRNRSLNYLESFQHAKKEYINNLKEAFTFEQFTDDELAEKKAKLNKEIAELPEKMQEVLKMIIFENKKYKEVAEELDVSINTIKTQYSRALKKLRSSLDILVLILVA